MALRLLTALVMLLAAGAPAFAQAPPQPDTISQFVDRLQDLALKADTASISRLSTTPNGHSVEEFVRVMTPAPSQLVIKERDRTTLPGGGQRLLLEVFAAQGIESRVFTWQMDLDAPPPATTPTLETWRIVRLDRLSIVTGLFRLSLDTTKQFEIRNLTIKAPDLTLQMASGTAFMASTPEGPTALVLQGRGHLVFSPPDTSERTQVRIFSGAEQLTNEFDSAFVRIRPSEFRTIFGEGTLTPRQVDTGSARRASEYFDEYIGRSLHLDLNDLSRDRWSLVPQQGDFIAEIRTKKFGNLTYARAQSDPEDVSVFDRRRKKHIAVYTSQELVATRGRSYSEDDYVDYDIRSYDLDADFTPDRLWIDGRASLALTTVAPGLASITLRIANELAVRSVFSPELGRLMYLRVVGQNAVIVNFPIQVPQGTRLNLQIVYGGRLEPQELDREAIALQPAQEQEAIILQPEPRYIYSNRSYWYPQSTVADYATAHMQITVPPEYDAIASGTPAGPAAPAPGPVRQGERARKMFVFNSDRPLRYLAVVISRFNLVTTANLMLPSSDDVRATNSDGHGPQAAAEPDAQLALAVQANPRQASRGRSTAERSGAIFQFYASVVGDAPYPSFTVALSESALPGGHSPAYFAVLNQTLPTAPFTWQHDPVSFAAYPTFFLAHELAHQWWGQAVGWKNYHEQWLSEGIAQYFAVMFAEKERGDDAFVSVLRQMRRWAIDASPQGPVYLGYRLGHIKGDSRIFRAVVYNKAAMVVHMLRGLMGEDAFFRGLRAFYTEWRFRKAGTEEFRAAMEKASGQNLQAFFEAWIYGTAIPRVSVRHTIEGSNAIVTIEQRGEVVPLPVTVTLVYAGGNTERLVIPSLERTTTKTLALTGPLRELVVNEEQSLAVFER
jgi:hypothetical protein